MSRQSKAVVVKMHALESRRMLDATAADLVGPEPSTFRWNYSVTESGMQGYNVPSWWVGNGYLDTSIVPGGTYNGKPVIEKVSRIGQLQPNGAPSDPQTYTLTQYDEMTPQGYVEYADARAPFSDTNTYDTPLVVLPAKLVKEKTFDSKVVDHIHQVYSGNQIEDSTGYREVQTTLLGEPGDGTIAVTGYGTYPAYKVRQTITQMYGDGTKTSNTYLVYYGQKIGIVLVTDDSGNIVESLNSSDGSFPRGTANENSTLPDVSIVPSAYPAFPGTAAPANTAVTVFLTNNTKGRTTSTATLTLYLSSTGKLDSDSLPIGTSKTQLTLDVGFSKSVAVPLSYKNLPAGSYSLFVTATDSTGTVNVTDAKSEITIYGATAPQVDVVAADLMGPQDVGNELIYNDRRVPGAGTGYSDSKVLDPTTYNGYSAIVTSVHLYNEYFNLQTISEHGSGFEVQVPATMDCGTTKNYNALTGNGWVQYGEFGPDELTRHTFDSPLVQLPATMIKNETYDSKVTYQPVDDDPEIIQATAFREVQVTLLADADDNVTVQTVGGAFNHVYKIRQTVTNSSPSGIVNSQTLIVYYAKGTGAVYATDEAGNRIYSLSEPPKGTLAVGIANGNSALMQPSFYAFNFSTPLTENPPTNGAATVSLKNNSTGVSTDETTISVFLSSNGKYDSDSINIGMQDIQVTNLLPDATELVGVKLRYTNLPGGHYKVFVTATDGSGKINISTVGPDVVVDAPPAPPVIPPVVPPVGTTPSPLTAAITGLGLINVKSGLPVTAKIQFQNTGTDIIRSLNYIVSLVPTDGSAAIVLKSAALHHKFKANGKQIKIKLKGKVTKAIAAGNYMVQITYTLPTGESQSLSSAQSITIKSPRSRL